MIESAPVARLGFDKALCEVPYETVTFGMG